MNCPRDGRALATERYEADLDVDVCSECRGIWLDKGELEQIEEVHERNHARQLRVEPDTVAASLEMARQAARPAAACPSCQVDMERREYGLASQILIEVCPAGCGLWLDEGELAALEVFFERERRDAHEPTGVIRGLWATLKSVFA
jgi:Zn-finger nucleic acid-binding protein